MQLKGESYSQQAQMEFFAFSTPLLNINITEFIWEVFMNK